MCSKCNKCCDNSCKYECCPVMSDCLAKQIECAFKKVFPDAAILPCIGMPSNNKCVMTLTHSLCPCAPVIKINGLESNSLLVNNAFFSSEVSCGKWLNMYQINFPNVPGKCGCKSLSEIYTEAIVKMGISVEDQSTVFKGICPDIITISSQAIDMDPIEFVKKQLCALKSTLKQNSRQCC